MEKSMIEALERIHQKYDDAGDNIISALQDIQEVFGYLPEEAVYWFSKKTNIPASKFFGVSTFYAQFYLKPRGKNIITSCCGTVCHVKGAHRNLFQLNQELDFPKGEDTTKDGMFTLEKVACLGACSIAPVIVVNKKVYGRMTPEKVTKAIKSTIKSYKEKGRE